MFIVFTLDKMDEGDEEAEEVEEWDDDQMGIEECLFCSKISKSLVKNVKHMTTDHSFFIPDIDYLVDLEGLIGYLGMLLLLPNSMIVLDMLQH